MYLKPAFRTKGIGSLIIEKIKAIAKEKSWKRVDVTAPTDDIWENTVRFYRKCGFNYTGPKLKWQSK